MDIKPISIKLPENANVILGQTHFIKSVEDIFEALTNAVPGIKFGLAFAEASGPCLIRKAGTDQSLIDAAVENMQSLSCGHTFIIFLKNAFPVNVLNAVKNVPEVCSIFAATANQLDVLVVENARGRGIVGVIDGEKSKGIETEKDVEERKSLLRKFGYKM